MKSKLKEWLEKTGYPLEIRGEKILSDYEFDIINSHLYKDSEKNIYRELDLWASKYFKYEGIQLTINLLIECKKSEKPFILINTNDKKKSSFSFGEYIMGFENPNVGVLLNNPDTDILLPPKSSSGFKLIQGFTNSDETIHKATNTLLKSFDFWLQEETVFLKSYVEENHQQIVFPLLLIDAPFFELKIDEDSELQLNEIDSGILEYRTHLLDKNVYEPIPIPIIRVEKLHLLIETLISYGKNTLSFLERNPLNQIENLYDRKYSLEKIIKEEE